MNKTININLAGIFFHIDEEAYSKLHRYLESIKKSFLNSPGSDEIIADVEARIAELFSERMLNERQVINSKDVDEVIAIMGQPEDYLVDEDVFEDAPNSKTTYNTKKQLFRDTDNKFIAGVSAGLGHYFGIDPVWLRIVWIVLVILGFGSPILVYIILWVIMPEAQTTAQKLAMTGKPVNLSSIEKKVKEGFDDVTNRVKNVDYEKVGKNVKSGTQSFFDAIGRLIMGFFKIIGKIVGVFIILISLTILVSLLISLFTLGTANFINFPGWDYVTTYFLNGPMLWIFCIVMFLAIGIPTFFFFILGLKIISSNVKSIGNIAKYTLLGLWIVSILSLVVLGLKKASEFNTTGDITYEQKLNLNVNDTINIRIEDFHHEGVRYHDDHFNFIEVDGEKKLIIKDLDLKIKATRDTLPYVRIINKARGYDFAEAKRHAEGIEYDIKVENNELILGEYFSSPIEDGYKKQEIDIVLYLPENTIIYLEKSLKGHIWNLDNKQNMWSNNMLNHTWIMERDLLNCLDCELDESLEEEEEIIESSINLNSDGINIEVNSTDENVKVNVGTDGVKIKSN